MLQRIRKKLPPQQQTEELQNLRPRGQNRYYRPKSAAFVTTTA